MTPSVEEKGRCFRRLLARISAATVITVAIACAVPAVARVWNIVFTHAHHRVVPPELRTTLEQVRVAAPEGSRFLYVRQEREVWFPMYWQRLLYPDPVFILDARSNFDEKAFESLVRRFDVRFALSAGSPPIDPGYRWKVALQPPTGAQEQLWFGELAR